MADTTPHPPSQEPPNPTTTTDTDTGRAHRYPPVRPRARPVMSPNRLALMLATVLVGLSAGFFFTYEASVTLGLADVGDLAYVETFQAINDTIRNPAFGIVFFGSVPAIGLALVANWRTASPVARGLLVAALPLYLVGLMITGTGNVPLNSDLAEVATLTPETAAVAREAFEDDWNRLNLVRSIAVAASFVSLAAACIVVSARHHDADHTTRQTGRP